jgi:hypothetical protein
MILFVSPSAPCRDNNDGTMLVRMNIHRKIKRTDRIALDGGYTLFLDQILDDTDLTEANFVCPVCKQRGLELSPAETQFNKIFGSFRSQIEAIFGEIGTTFERFNNRMPIRVTEIKHFTLQFKLACLLLNIKKFVTRGNIQHKPVHSLWMTERFDFGGDGIIPDDQIRVIELETNESNDAQMLALQQQFLDLDVEDDNEMDIVDDDENGIRESQRDQGSDDSGSYEVEAILDHRTRRKRREYYVRWKGYLESEDSWVRADDMNAPELIKEYEEGNDI